GSPHCVDRRFNVPVARKGIRGTILCNRLLAWSRRQLRLDRTIAALQRGSDLRPIPVLVGRFPTGDSVDQRAREDALLGGGAGLVRRQAEPSGVEARRRDYEG